MTAQLKAATPFPFQTRKVHKPMDYIDPELLKVEHNTPLPQARRIYGKYDDLFGRMRYGSCVVCEGEEMNKVANALRKWLEREKQPGKVVSIKRCEDGKARVWLMKQE